MTPNDLRRMMALVKDEYIEEAVDCRPARHVYPWKRWATLAACLCVVMLGGCLLFQSGGLFSRLGGCGSSDSAMEAEYITEAGSDVGEGSADANGDSTWEGRADEDEDSVEDPAPSEMTQETDDGNSGAAAAQAEAAAAELNGLFGSEDWFGSAYAEGERCIVVLREDTEAHRAAVLERCSDPEIVVFEGD